jgi:hypothetical protein
LSHDATQPTLSAPHAGSLADRIGALPLVDLAALAAFESSRDEPAPISPTLRFTFELAGRLRRAHVLQLLEEAPRGLAWGQARAIYDPIAWAYLADPPEPGVLRHCVAAGIQRRVSEGALAEALWLWQRLADSELEGYIAHLLRRHQMEPTWARDLVDRTVLELEELCLAQRRALCWSGLKEGAATFLRTKGDAKQCFDAIVAEVRRQARWLRRHQPQASGWIPSGAWRQPLLLRTFLATFPLGYRYWTGVPSLAALEADR